MSIEVAIQKELRGFRLDMEFSGDRGRLGILGASGCGKSMTLKCIAGIVTPDRGRIVLNDKVLFDSEKRIDLRPQQRRVGYLFQNYALFPHMKVIENVALGMGLGKQEARKNAKIKEMVNLFHLEGLEERFPGQLSGGQQQRVALARILAYQPDIILLDEPFSALDAYLKEQLQLQLAEILNHYGENVIMVTHNRDEVYKLCDRLMVMDQGRSIRLGNTKDIFNDPGQVQIARLTGCKNLSAARKAGEFLVEALDWGVSLQTAVPVAEDITAVGIRAHHFSPALAGEVNAISLREAEETESLFERNVIFRAGKGGENSLIWWQFSKEAQSAGLPEYVKVAAEKVLLLR